MTFLAYSYVLRVLEGIAEAASWSAVFAMLLQMFPSNVATAYSLTEASFSFSEMVGPTLGALLYSVGGFALPFELCGVLCLVTGASCVYEFFRIEIAGAPTTICRNLNSFIGLLTILVIPNDPTKQGQRKKPEEEEEEAEETTPLHTDSILLQVPSASNGVPNGVPNGGVPSGGVPSGGVPNGGVPKGSVPNGGVPNGIRNGSVVSARGSVHRHRGDTTANHAPHRHGSAQILPVLRNADVMLALTGTVYAAAVQVGGRSPGRNPY